jgi:hypothetical protein
MLNEGIITNDARSLVKSEMIRQLRMLGETTPEIWERRVFRALTGHSRRDVDWEFEDNQAGYYTWIKSFDGLIDELVEDGYAKVVENEDRTRTMVAVETDPAIEYSYMAYPSGVRS